MFDARYHGHRGVVTVLTSAASPCLTFSREATLGGTTDLGHKKVESEPLWAIGLADVVEIRKVGGLGWKVRRRWWTWADGADGAACRYGARQADRRRHHRPLE